MNFDKEDSEIILLLPVMSGVKIFLSILPRSKWQLVWVKPWLQHRSIKSVYLNIIYTGTKTTRLL